MAWPPPVFDTTFTNADPQLDDHPNIHNQVNESLNADFRPQIDSNTAAIGVNAGGISTNAANLDDHESNADGTWQKSYTDNAIDEFNESAPQLRWTNDNNAASFRMEGMLNIRMAHGVVHVAFYLTVQSNVTGVTPGQFKIEVDVGSKGFPGFNSSPNHVAGNSFNWAPTYAAGALVKGGNNGNYVALTAAVNGEGSAAKWEPTAIGSILSGQFWYPV